MPLNSNAVNIVLSKLILNITVEVGEFPTELIKKSQLSLLKPLGNGIGFHTFVSTEFSKVTTSIRFVTRKILNI